MSNFSGCAQKGDNTIIHLSDIKYFVFQVNIHPYLRCETICASQQIYRSPKTVQNQVILRQPCCIQVDALSVCTCRHEAFRQRTEWNIEDEPTLGAVCYILGVEYRTGQVLSRAATGGLQRIAGPEALEGWAVWVILPWNMEVPSRCHEGWSGTSSSWWVESKGCC